MQITIDKVKQRIDELRAKLAYAQSQADEVAGALKEAQQVLTYLELPEPESPAEVPADVQ